MPKIMTLDLAKRTGFAIGYPGDEKPISGSILFASDGASHEAIFAKALGWFSSTIREHKPDVVVWEAPLPTSFSQGHTTVKVTSILFGLPAIVGAVAYLLGIYELRTADVRDVRRFFIGGNPKREIAKKLTMQQCRMMGWDFADDNEADALAIWAYYRGLVEPRYAIAPSPLFIHASKKTKRARGKS